MTDFNPTLIAISLLSALSLLSCAPEQTSLISRSEKRVLLLQEGLTDSSRSGIETLTLQLEQLAATDGFSWDQSTDYSLLSEDSLPAFSAVVLWNLTEDSLSLIARNALERYTAAGGGVLVVDQPDVTPYLWHWYERLLNDSLPAGASAFGPLQAMEYGGGRIVRSYDAVNAESDHWRDALEYAIGDNSYDYARVDIPLAPQWNQFTRKVLDDDIYEPMEMVILPFGEVLFLERRGKMKLYDPVAQATEVIAEFDVCTEGNYEDGLHGLALDPAYGRENHHLYLYYSPPCDTPYQYLSRFVFKNKKLERDSEIVMLRVFVQRETCCHSGGSVEFGPDGLLYLSTGDNTSSKESDGYTPIDERPGRSPFDAQKSSGNTNDLRGKILRIRPEADGSYSIPEGNLFADGQGGRPEIYTMGCRNPFRIAIDARHNILYWGDVGPDVGEDGRYGPQSYDEFNQAREAGFYGWPYFVADNKAYPDRDFTTDEVGELFDPQRPINDSPNNTGARELPPAQPAMIWYPYGASDEFPMLGQGSRSSLAGPFYYTDGLMPLSTIKFPDYYVGKWFIYEWARSWIKVATFDDEQRLVQIEDFMPDMELSKPIELEFGPDGALYILEYGNQYFMDNPDARLVRLEFARNNRPPVARMEAGPLAGSAPHTVTFSAAGSFDYDARDSLRFLWSFNGNEEIEAEGPEVSYTFLRNGVYTPTLRVVDSKGAAATATTTVEIGNTPPEVAIRSRSNRSFFSEDQTSWDYAVDIQDQEDQQNGGLDLNRALVNYTYVDDAQYLQDIMRGRVQLPDGPLQYLKGARLIQGSDCNTCHHEVDANIGPSFRQIAERYPMDRAAVGQLAGKIIRGGNGVWGEAMMSAHPQLSQEEAEEMVRYILSLGTNDRKPLQGQIALREHIQDLKRTIMAGNSEQPKPPGGYVITAAYRDQGNRQARPVTTRKVQVLRYPKVEAETADVIHLGQIPTGSEWGAYNQVNLKADSYLSFRDIDLTGIRKVALRLIHPGKGRIELRLGNPRGDLAGGVDLSPGAGEWTEITLAVAASGVHDLYFVFITEQEFIDNHGGTHHPKDMFFVDWLRFQF